MKTKALVSVGIVFAAFMSAAACAQAIGGNRGGSTRSGTEDAKQTMKSTVTFSNEFSVTIATNVESASGVTPQASGSIAFGTKDNGGSNGNKFIFRNIGFKDACYAYNLTVEPVEDPYKPRFRVSFHEYDRELASSLQELTGLRGCPAKKDLVVQPIPGLPEPQLVAEGDTIALDILSNPQTGIKIVDLIKITREHGKANAQTTRKAP